MTSPPARARAAAPQGPRKVPGRYQGAEQVKAFLPRPPLPARQRGCLDIMAMVRSYRTWCAEKGEAPADLDAILDEIEQLCGKLGVNIEAGDDQRVYVYGVKIEAPTTVSVH